MIEHSASFVDTNANVVDACLHELVAARNGLVDFVCVELERLEVNEQQHSDLQLFCGRFGGFRGAATEELCFLQATQKKRRHQAALEKVVLAPHLRVLAENFAETLALFKSLLGCLTLQHQLQRQMAQDRHARPHQQEKVLAFELVIRIKCDVATFGGTEGNSRAVGASDWRNKSREALIAVRSEVFRV